jgi:hypothetical protein
MSETGRLECCRRPKSSATHREWMIDYTYVHKKSLELCRVAPYSESGGRLRATGRVRYSRLKGADRGEAFMEVQPSGIWVAGLPHLSADG